MGKQIVELMWTGGFDSTYRLCELIRMGVTVKPYYIFYKGRLSIPFELEAQRNILEYLNSKGCLSNVLPVEYIEPDSFTIDRSIVNCYFDVFKDYGLAVQTVLFTGFSKIHPNIEICYEKRNNDFMHFIDKETVLLKNDVGSFVLDKEKSSARSVLLFGDFTFPLLKKTNKEMYDDMIKWGFAPLLKMIHFCSMDTKEPCGVCSSCYNKLNDGLFNDYFSEEAIKHYHVYASLRELCKLDSRSEHPFHQYRYLVAIFYSVYVRFGYSKFFNLCLHYKIDFTKVNKLSVLFKKFDAFTIEEIHEFFKKYHTISEMLEV